MTLLLVFAQAKEQLHPVRQEIVDDIMLKTTSWKPKAVENNKLRHRSPESIKNSMGHLGVAPSVVPTAWLKTMASGATSLFKQVAHTFGIESVKNEHLRLKQGSDAAEKSDKKSEGEDEQKEPESEFPDHFSWRDERPECLGVIQD